MSSDFANYFRILLANCWFRQTEDQVKIIACRSQQITSSTDPPNSISVADLDVMVALATGADVATHHRRLAGDLDMQ